MNKMFTISLLPPKVRHQARNSTIGAGKSVRLCFTGTYRLFIDEAFVMAFDQLALDLLHRIQCYTNYDQQ